MQKAIIKIFVSCHKNFYVPECSYLFPIQVGCSLAEEKLPGMLHDDEGKDQISALNRFYCELTGQYWSWKNVESDYYGFFHYRRYLDFNSAHGVKKPYYLEWYPDDRILSESGYDENNIRKIISGNDIIVPIPENMNISVYEHYKCAPHHRIHDLDIVIGIIREKYPEYYSSAKEYLNQTYQYFGNIFIMKKEIFNHYCGWLFDILSEYDKIKNTKGYSTQELRVDGYLAERMLGMYIFMLKENKNYSILELPRIHFEGMNGTKSGYYKNKIKNFILPPGSKMRAEIKKIFKKC